MADRTTLTETIDVEGAPDRFRIFKAGLNPSDKGDFLYDSEAAANILSAFQARKVDMMIDLEHLSIDTESKAYNPDAMGWAQLEDIDGELWAVDVRWTPEGKERIESKKQRYISPVIFFSDKEKTQIASIYNIALTAQPATLDAYPLIAAKNQTLRIEGNKMEEMQVIKDLLGLDPEADLEAVLEAIRAIIAAATEEDPQEPSQEEASQEGEDEAQEEASQEDPQEPSQEQASQEGEDEEESSSELLSALGKLTRQNIELASRLETLEKAHLIKSNPDKIPPALEGWAVTLSRKDLEKFLAKSKGHGSTSRAPQKEEGQTVKLSRAELEVSKLTGVSAEKILKFKQGQK